MPNHDSSITISLKIDSLFDEFAGELTLLKSIPPGFDETDCHPEKETRLPRDCCMTTHLLDSDSHIEEIDLSFNPDDPIPPGIEDDDYDSRRDIPILEELLDNYSLSLPNNESYHFDIPSPDRPPVKLPDVKMSRDVLTVASTMRIPLLYQGEYSQWVERFMNYLEEQTDGEAMINLIKNGDQPLPRVTPVPIAGTTSTKQPPLKDKSMCNKTAKYLWDALARHMLGSEYGVQDRKAAILYEYETFKASKGELLLDTYIRYLQVINDLKKCGYSKDNYELNFKFLNNLQPEWKQYATMMRQNKNLMEINIDALYNILKQNQVDVNDAMGSKKKPVVVTSDPLALIAEKTNVSRSKEKVIIYSDSEGSEADDFSELKKITALLAKAFNRRKFYSKPTNSNLRTSSTSQSANKKKEFVKSDDKKVKKKADEKKRDMSRVKCYNYKKEGHFAKDCKKAKVKYYEYYKTKMLLAKKDKDEQVLLAEDQAWMESSSDSDKAINANMVFMAQIEKVLSDSEASSSSDDEKISEIVQICLWIIDLDVQTTVGNTQKVYAVGAYQAYQAPVYQAPVHQPQIPQPQVVTTNEFTNFMKANGAILKNMKTNMTSLTNSNLELKNMFGQFMKINTASSLGSGTLPGNTITNPKGITNRSGTVYQGPTIPTTSFSLPPIVERDTEATKDTVHPTNNGSTKDVQPLVVQTESPILNYEPVVASIIETIASLVSALKPNQRPLIPYPFRLHDQKLRDKANDQREKFFQIFKDLNFNISFFDALILMPKFGPSIKSLLTNKDKLCELARTPLNEHCSAVLLKKLPEKLGDPDFDADPRVPLILGRSFLKTGRSLIDVFKGKLTLRVGKEAITFNLDQTLRYSANYNDMTANRIDVIDMACEEYS
nr:reverse transcriptase domain-containing protein [Tanacetum cinerariifolium]